jgi:hypothetical protein
MKSYGPYKTGFKSAAEVMHQIGLASGYSDAVTYVLPLHKAEMKGQHSYVDVAELEQVLIEFFWVEEVAKELFLALEESKVVQDEKVTKAINKLKFSLLMTDDY